MFSYLTLAEGVLKQYGHWVEQDTVDDQILPKEKPATLELLVKV